MFSVTDEYQNKLDAEKEKDRLKSEIAAFKIKVTEKQIALMQYNQEYAIAENLQV